MRSGFIAIIGKPNAGKSSLTNRLTGEKISIVTPKPQTTRDAVRAILTTSEYQMIFVDTPGLLKPRTELGKYMSRESGTSSRDADALVIVIDGSRPFGSRDYEMIESRLKSAVPVYVVINKTDIAGYEKVYPILSALTPLTGDADGRHAVKDIIPVSCVSGDNIDLLRDKLAGELKDEVMYYPEGDVTDKPMRYVVGEIIREKALLLLRDEVPHGVGITVGAYEDKKDSVYIEADVVCEREGHKRIIIGDGGSMIKRIGHDARLGIMDLTGKNVYLKLFVKVREDWRNKRNYMRDLGYGD